MKVAAKKLLNITAKTAISLAVLATLTAYIIINADLSDRPRVFVNGSEISTDGFIVDGRTYVPLRMVSEAMGAEVSWSDEDYAASVNFSGGQSSVPAIISQVSPSVVAIVGNYTPGYVSDSSKYLDKTAHGAGAIIKSTGEIITNAHVVDGLSNITVILADGNSYAGKVLYKDAQLDLAVVKINRSDLTPIKISESKDIVVGQTVVAIGTPISLSLRNSASMGIVSGMNRAIGSDYALIQTDAAINPGNSGGPLVNMKGELIGVNSSKYTGIGIESMGFSIPADTVNAALRKFEGAGLFLRPSIGAKLEETWEAMHGLPTSAGLYIKTVDADSPAAAAGIAQGDMLTAVNGIAVHSLVDWNEAVKGCSLGDNINVTIKRGDGFIEVAVAPKYK